MFSPLDQYSNDNLTLQELSLKKAEQLIPSIVYLAVLTLCGVSGNGLVLVIFYRKFCSSIHRCFILSLAVFDFLACSIGTPWAIAEAFHVFTYTDAISCKLFRFCLYYFTVNSSLTLVLIAMERHRKIVSPLKRQMTVRLAKKALFLVFGIISPISCCPVFFLYGTATIHTQIGNLSGTRCFITDHMSQTAWPALFNVYLLLLAIISTLTMSTCYFRVARRVAIMGNANIQKRTMKASEKSNASLSSLHIDEHELESDSNMSASMSSQMKMEQQPSPRTSQMRNARLDVSVKTKTWATKVIRKLSNKSSQKTIRITRMLIVVTAVFILSYLPHLVLMLLSMIAGRDAEVDPSFPRDNFYQILFYSFTINNIINPVIYGIMDEKFRRECKKILCCRHISNNK